MKCKHLTYRSNKKVRTLFCRLNKCFNPICTKECFTPRDYKPLVAKTPLKKSNKPIKQYSKKRAEAEKERYSIFTSDLKHCIEDKDHRGKIDKHECFNGKNRLKSMKYGLVVPLCRSCHEDEEVIKKWQRKGRQAFIKEYGEETFIKEFQTKKGMKE